MGSYISVYPGGLTGNAVDDVQVGDLIGKDKIKQKNILTDDIDSITMLPKSIYEPENIEAGKRVGAAAVSAVDNLANKISGIIDGASAAFRSVYSFVLNYWQFLILAAVSLVIIREK